MANGLVIHVEVGAERHTEVLTRPRIRIGAGADCDLRFQPDLLPPQTPDLLLELVAANGHYRVAGFARAFPLTHNGRAIKEGRDIADGDQVRLAGSDFTLQFFPLSAPPALVPERTRGVHVAPFIEDAAIEAAATARRDDAKVFLREFTRELLREIKLSTKFIILLFALALVGGTLYLGFAFYKELKQSRRQIEAQNQQIGQLNQQISHSQEQFKQVDKRNLDIINSLSLAPKLRSEYGSGVCLISGTYIFVEAGTGRPLRYPEAQPTPADATAAPPDGEQPPLLTPEGNGPVAEFPYVGTGFHVGGGFIITNRHVAVDPWVADERAMVFGSSVSGRPRLTKLMAYFPGLKQPLPLRHKQSSPRDDVAVCALEVAEVPAEIPALPLDSDTDATAVGKAVVLMGYPSGPDRILASLPDEDANNIKQRFGSSVDVLVGRLAELNLIKPLTTQGHITDYEAHRIIYDARTAEGGSGAPLFGQSGRVIGVNFAIFTEIQDANFAVPVRYAITLLQRAGWKPAAPEADNAANSNTPQKDARTTSASSTNQSR
jgi:S1-C subfamily serine protease